MSIQNIKREPSSDASSNSELDNAEVRNDHHLMQNLDRKKEKFERDLIRLQDGIKYNENQLLENSKKCLEEQKKFDDEVKKLESENENLKKDIETISIEHLKSLESEIELVQMANLNLQYQNKELENKIGKCALELRHAVKIIAALNAIVADYHRKASENVCVMTQTNFNEEIKIMPEVDCAPGGDQRYKSDPNLENWPSDVCFKPKTFMKSEAETKV